MIPTSSKLAHANDFRDLPRWLWLWVPLAYVTLHFTLAGISRALYEKYLGGGELGTNELSTMALLIVAVLIGLHTLWIMRGLEQSDWRLWVWLILGTLGCVYFGGEEASWGQHLIGWETSEAWQQFNDQQETNLHNSDKYGPLLDQLPRNLLTLGMLVGAIIAPLWRRSKQITLDPAGINFWIWPTMVCLPAGIFGVAISWPEGIYSAITGNPQPPRFNISSGELKEWCIAYFLMIYLASFNLRLRQVRAAIRDSA